MFNIPKNLSYPQSIAPPKQVNQSASKNRSVQDKAEFVKKFVENILHEGKIEDASWVNSGIPSDRNEYVTRCLENAGREYAGNCLNISKEDFIRKAVLEASEDGTTARLSEAFKISSHQIHNDICAIATGNWENDAEPHLSRWAGLPLADHTRKVAERKWNVLASHHATLLASTASSENFPQEMSSAMLQPGAKSIASTLYHNYIAGMTSPQANANVIHPEEANVFDTAFGHKVPEVAERRDDGVEPMDISPDHSQPNNRSVTNFPMSGEAALENLIPPSRRASLHGLIDTVRSDAQRKKIGKQDPRTKKKFEAGLAELNKKPGRSNIDHDMAIAIYEDKTKQYLRLPKDINDGLASRAIAMGVGSHASDYTNARRAKLAMERQVGSTATAYTNYQKWSRLAREQGIDDSATAYLAHVQTQEPAVQWNSYTTEDYRSNKRQGK